MRRGNVGNRGGGRPSDRFRRLATEQLEDWLKRSAKVLREIQRSATTVEEKLKFVEAAGKLADRFGKYTGIARAELLEDYCPPVVLDFSGMKLEERKELLAQLKE